MAGVGRIQNLRLWQPGQSGNPGGRPSKKVITSALEREVGEILTAEEAKEWNLPAKYVGLMKATVLAKIAVAKAAQGDVSALDKITDRLEGKPFSALELRSSAEAPINVHGLLSDAKLAQLEAIALEVAASPAVAELLEGGEVIDAEPESCSDAARNAPTLHAKRTTHSGGRPPKKRV